MFRIPEPEPYTIYTYMLRILNLNPTSYFLRIPEPYLFKIPESEPEPYSFKIPESKP